VRKKGEQETFKGEQETFKGKQETFKGKQETFDLTRRLYVSWLYVSCYVLPYWSGFSYAFLSMLDHISDRVLQD